MKIGVANATPATYTPNVLFGVTHTHFTLKRNSWFLGVPTVELKKAKKSAI